MKKIFFCFKQISKCNTCFYLHFSRAFQTFRSLALVIKNVMGYFFHRPDFFPPCTLKIKKFNKTYFKLLFKSHKMSRRVSKIRVLGPKKNASSPSACSGLNKFCPEESTVYHISLEVNLFCISQSC